MTTPPIIASSLYLRRDRIVLMDLEAVDGSGDALMAIDIRSGRPLAFWGPDFPPEHKQGSVPETNELMKIFESAPDASFAPRIRGLVIGTVHAIRYGWRTPRDARNALDAIIATPEKLPADRQVNWLMQLTLSFLNVDPVQAITRSLEILTEMRAAFAEVVGRGRPRDETRSFLLEELAWLALDNGMELRLPQHRDEREHGVTPFFTLVLAVIDIVCSRVYTGREPPAAAVRRRLAPFRCSRVALLDALERARQAVQAEKTFKNSNSS
jgi:hypothetical protein